ncbi:MAG: InlB B-repeat-containing protein, partial [bacterium]
DKYITGNFGHWLQTLSYPTEGGTVTLNPDKEVYDHNEVVNISAEPAEGFYFKCWQGGGIAEPDSANTTVTMDENRTITAKFQEIVTETVTLTMQKEPEAGGTIDPPPGTHTYIKGDTVDISATAAEGYRFKKWECSVEDPYDPTTVVYMNYNETVTAIFESDSVTLHLKAFPEKGGTTNPPPGTYTYERDDTVDIEAFPAEGYRFLKWQCNVGDPYDPSTVVYMPENETVTARFELITNRLIISVDPEEGGTTEPAVGTHEYEPGTTVQVTAIPAEGYEFVNWTGLVSEPDSQTTSITMDGKRSITANFEKIGYSYSLTLKVQPQAGGTTDPDPGTYTYSAGEIVELTAIPNQGYWFTGWSGEVSDKDSIHTTVLIDVNKTVTAGFEIIDTIPPELKNCHPCPYAKAVPRNTNIKFKLYDQKSGLNSNTLNVWMNDLQIIKEGINQKGDEVQLVHNAHILKITYKPAESFENGTTVSVSVSCSDNAPAANHLDSTYSFVVGTAFINKTVKDSVDEKGGSVVDTTSNITIQVPPHAVDDTTEITIDHIEDAPALPADVSGIATPYHFGPDGYEFKVPVVICIPYTQAMLDSAGITDPMKLNLYYFHSLTGEWTKLIIDSVNTGQKNLYITVDQFCYFNLVKEKTQTAIDDQVINESNNPDDFYRLENYPNPFNPETHIQFSIQNAGYVILSVYNMKGNLIRILVDEPKQKGEYDIIWDGMDHNNHQVSTGIYVVRMKVGNQILIRKVTLLK